MADIEAQAKEYWEAGDHQALSELIVEAIQGVGLYAIAQEEEHRGMEMITVLTFGVPLEEVEDDSQVRWCLTFQKPGVSRRLSLPPLPKWPEYTMCYHTSAKQIVPITTVDTITGILSMIQSSYKP
jgi:hypothetical protein